MGGQQTHELDASIREAQSQLLDGGFGAPEVLLLLATGASDIEPLLENTQKLSFGEIQGAPKAWSATSLSSGKLGETRVWLCEDTPQNDPAPWARSWPIWLARQCGAGRALLSIGASPLPAAAPACQPEGFLLVEDHLMLEGSTPLLSLSSSNLGPLFPDQGGVHDKAARDELLTRAKASGLPCEKGVMACIPGPALETPAEQRYHALAGAHASAQNLGSLYHAMAHSGLSSLTIAALLGKGDAAMEDLIASAQRLAPGLAELIPTAVEILAHNGRQDAKEQL